MVGSGTGVVGRRLVALGSCQKCFGWVVGKVRVVGLGCGRIVGVG